MNTKLTAIGYIATGLLLGWACSAPMGDGDMAKARAQAVTPCNVVQINGQSTDGNNAVLSLKQLNIVNSAGAGLVAWSTGGYAGIDARGHHGIKGTSNVDSGSGMYLEGADTGNGGDGLALQGRGIGGGLVAHGGNQNAPGIFGAGGWDGVSQWGGMGAQFLGATNGNGLNVIAGPGGTTIYAPRSQGGSGSYVQGLQTPQ